MKKLFFILCLFLTMGAYATYYYCNPATGTMSNPGTLASPWSTLQAVLAAGKTFVTGDVIYLMSGNHGFPVINKSNAGYVTITRYAGSDPVINRIDFSNASRWVIDNVKIFTTATPPEAPVLQHPVYPKLNNTLVRVMNNSSYITFSNCFIYSIENNTAWTTADDWNNKAWNGLNITSGSHHVTINACTIRNVNFAIEMNSTENNTVQHSTIENICGDGIRPGSYATIEYNTIRDIYLTNGNHYDLIQGFASAGIVIRGNILTNATANRAFLDYDCQGIGLFDGFFDNFIIENNLVILHHYHGISLYGARNCRIVNNTVVKNPVGSTNMMPWIGFFPHKDGTNGSGNSMSNNLVCDIESTNGATTSNNIITTAYTSHFINYTGFDMHLKSGSTAINAGTTTNAPAIDLEKKARMAPYDVGCYEYGSGLPTAIGDTPQEDKNFIRLYPNPVTDNSFSIDLGKAIERPTTIRIIDLTGKLVYSQSAGRVNQVVLIDCQLTSGMYIVETMSGNATMSRKIIVR
jgi:parallel beta-helix repeat protein